MNAKNYELRARDPEAYRRRHRTAYLKRTYDLSLDEYDAMLAAQGGVCAICGAERDRELKHNGRNYLTPRYGAMPVDHDPTTGRNRGILCSKCNRGIGHFDHDIARMEAAIAYLRRTAS